MRIVRVIHGWVLLVGLITGPASAADDPAIATIGHDLIHEKDVTSSDPEAFRHVDDEYERGLHQLQMKYAQTRYELLRKQLDRLLDRRALELEAAQRKVDPDMLMNKLQVPSVSDEEARAFYDQNRDRIQKPYDEVAPQVLQYLQKQRRESATRRFYDDLRARHDIIGTLPPFRAPVAAVGPSRGATAASVTIVEFADFQCPFCKRAEESLRTIMERHPSDVRLVFRNLPLTQIHPYALLAAEAGVCAERQRKFWEMHDAMYADQSALDAKSLLETALRLGLNGPTFSACLQDASTPHFLDQDFSAARDLGLTGTPYFFINGRPLDGDVPLDSFESIIDQELQRGAPKAG
jgi:protein-disulfide isomerase